MSASQQRSRSTFLKCRAPSASARSPAANARSLPHGPPGPTQFHPAPQHGLAQAKFLGHRSDRAATRSHQINRLPLIVGRKRPTLTSFHSTPPGSSSLLQVSINSEEVHRRSLLSIRGEGVTSMRPGAPNAKRPWEPEEEQQLRRLVDAGKSVMLIALRLRRTQQAVRQRLTILKISVRGRTTTSKRSLLK